ALSPLVAEVRSLAVDRAARGHGIGGAIVDELRWRARCQGFEKLCAFTHAPGYFSEMGFSIVPHTWLLEKIFTDCVKCPHFRACGQYAMVVNSGCADACTGETGMQAARHIASETAQLLNCPSDQVLVASTGVIGVALPIEKIRAGLPAAIRALSADQGSAAARAIMTTDPFPKLASAHLRIGARDAAIGGMAKGSGMIEPMMATMLAFVTHDASVPAPLLDRALREAVNDSFNAITVDGECSTNDCVMLLANGASGAVVDEATYPAFVGGLRDVCRELALGIVRGGE